MHRAFQDERDPIPPGEQYGPPAVDRRKLAGESLPKPSRWPRTGRRVARLEAVLRHRQPDLTVILENVHDPHNVSAVLRSCDAVGIGTLMLTTLLVSSRIGIIIDCADDTPFLCQGNNMQTANKQEVGR